jgi:acetyltransferase-like isoleucine patch superfamily enzyme
VRLRYPLRRYAVAATFFTLYGLVKYLPPPAGDAARALVLRPFLRRLSSWKIKDGVTFWFPEGVSIGRNVTINEWVFIDGAGGVEIGDHCRIAHGCSFISEDHVFDDPDRPIWEQGRKVAPVVLEEDVWLGCGVRVTRGVRIGKGSVIGAGSVVTRDIPPYSVAAGVPARVIKSRRPAQ